MSTVGFCLVTNVPGHNEEELLEAIKCFHNLPIEEKMKMAPKHFNQENSNTIHGYFPFLENDPSFKEFYDMARPLSDISKWEKGGCPLYEEQRWLDDSGNACGENNSNLKLEWVHKKFTQHFSSMHKLALQLISCLAVGLGKRADYFDSWFKDECSSVFRAIHYNPRGEQQGNRLVTPEHADSGFITLLSTFMYPGLEV
jgi:isopenicillin N synthase-like dioxygenase